MLYISVYIADGVSYTKIKTPKQKPVLLGEYRCSYEDLGSE